MVLVSLALGLARTGRPCGHQAHTVSTAQRWPGAAGEPFTHSPAVGVWQPGVWQPFPGFRSLKAQGLPLIPSCLAAFSHFLLQ